jgi:hypothetical protein
MRLWLRDIELAIGRSWPTEWLWLLRQTPSCGVMAACGLWHDPDAANDAQLLEPIASDEARPDLALP